ncbi:hypothetical protein EA472_19580 [Natrarchaeobius oligotrophus]|uniref:Uncharacterized protein n=1 Tax=Natrarchaeobius chitinivorans TaxID=1679083 RepID=A0A3N6MRV7_NATCH|nr:hypothetical protein EA472_19580 [Natrarchaeobius chitinivorans]
MIPAAVSDRLTRLTHSREKRIDGRPTTTVAAFTNEPSASSCALANWLSARSFHSSGCPRA